MKQEELYRRMASAYAEEYGARLLEEQRALEQDARPITPGLDRKVRRKLGAGRRNRALTGAALVAAALALALILPPMLERSRDSGGIAPPGAEAQRAAPLEEEAIDEDIAYDYEMDIADEAAGESPALGGEKVLQPGDVMPLTFTLPESFAVEDVELDNGKSVYHLSNRELDDVVMTLEAVPAQPVPQDLIPLPLGQVEARGWATADYNLLTFDWEGVRYELTCRHDMTTLMGLGGRILSGL